MFLKSVQVSMCLEKIVADYKLSSSELMKAHILQNVFLDFGPDQTAM